MPPRVGRPGNFRHGVKPFRPGDATGRTWDSRPGDETLLFAVAERDMGAFRTLYERHAGWLAIRLARRCNDRDLVADAIQDTFVAVWQKPGGFRGDGDNAAWLWGIALAQALTAWRGSPRFFLGWQCSPCARSRSWWRVLRGAEGRARTRIVRALGITEVAALIMLVLAALGGFTHAVTA